MPKMSQTPKFAKYLGVLILIVCISIVSFVVGRMFEQGSQYSTTSKIVNLNKEEFDSSLFWDVWEKIKYNYVDEDAFDEEKMFYGAIKGMVNALDDPGTVFLTAEEAKQFKEHSEGKYFEGVGMELGYRDNLVTVISPLDGSPAKEAGLMPGDVILKVDDTDVKANDSIYDVVQKIRGEKGTQVVITVMQRSTSEVKEFKIIRDAITVPSISFSKSDVDDVYIMKVGRFTESDLKTWASVWDSKVSEFLSTGSNKLVLDLRGNPGGFFDAGVYAAEEFLPKGTVVAKQEDRGGSVREYRVSRDGKLLNTKVVVLVNEGSASASEILAGALQQNERVKIVGIETYGKGTAQSVMDLYDGSSLHLTVVKWLLPDGSWINAENVIVPDSEVELSDEDFKAGRDPQLEKAIEILKK
jgi:carboxyl-terminal processing protease